MERIQNYFSPEQLAIITKFLQVINSELMPEIPEHHVAGVAGQPVEKV